MDRSSIVALFVKVDSASRATYAQTRDIDSLIINGVRTNTAYNASTNDYSLTTSAIRDISPSQIATGGFLGGSFVIPAVAGIQYAWAANAPYSYIRTIGRVGCICSTKRTIFPLHTGHTHWCNDAHTVSFTEQ
jgi:hypothetical protein